LSYASQDAEAARRICSALEAAGIDVWFDQSGLRGGDAWDQKIRRQIKECALFLPLISANTQQRTEGYFRLEWRLADQRTHLMGRSRPFIIPISIDATSDATADVPDSFLAVQWTRLVGGEATPAFCDRVKALLAGGDTPPATREASPGAALRPTTLRWGPKKGLLVGLGLAAAVAVVAILFVRRNQPTANTGAAGPQPSILAADATRETQADQLAAQARAIYDRVDYTRAGLSLAEDLSRKATEDAPASLKAWSTFALINAAFVQRGWDLSDARHQTVRMAANRALALDPGDKDAILSLALNVELTNPTEAESIARQAIKANPDEPRFYRVIAETHLVRGLHVRRLEFLKDIARRFPNDALCYYDLARAYRDLDQPDNPKAIECFKRCVAIAGVMPSAEVEIARLLMLEGDYAEADAALSKVPVSYASDDRVVAEIMRLGLLDREPDRTIEAAAGSSTEYFNDFIFKGPTAWMVALAYRLKGDAASEAHQWSIAESTERKRIAADPLNPDEHAALAVSLAWLGRSNEARQEMADYEALVKNKRFIAYYHAGLGDAEGTVAAIGQPLNLYNEELERDPWWDKVRSSPRFAEAIKTAVARKAGTHE
jgi:tetratricopeptide (TPR) repeat protein